MSLIPTLNAKELFTIAGSNTVGAKLAPQCARDYLESIGVENVTIQRGDVENEYLVSGNQGVGLDLERVSIRIEAHGSSTGFKRLDSGDAELAMASRPIKSKEIDALVKRGDMVSVDAEHTIGIDGLAILVSPNNPVATLTINQIARIFSGRIKNWKDLGGPSMPIELYARDEKSGTWDTFRKLVLSGDYELDARAQRYESNDQLSDAVAANMNAIGFAGLASVRDAKLLAVSNEDTAAMKPSTFTVATEDYPLSRRLFMYLPPDTQIPWVQDYVEFCQSEQGQKIVEKVGFVSQNIRSFRAQVNEAMPSQYQALAKSGERLSVNFRFSHGSPNLDNKAHRDLDRLIAFLKKSENREKSVYLVGFSDAGERFSQDLVLSRFRALAVRSALLREGLAVRDSYGLGSFMPVASNEDEGAKSKNGRVEVWLTDEPVPVL
ncbi:Protein SphX [BD1-7 clade bacterium]|uniref:Protein SphX n=1 Tax=BD1-7 clade bacterium TaxID=2029982 RepID=A0A5S9QEN0_9GAMM|nr:Protein SphX [BD1-7 clade bacterium]